MKSHARAVVIGGGVVGVSALYHLAEKGWTDSVLVERRELTSGSTWHAAGLVPLFNMSYAVGKLHQYSIDFYQRLEKETGQDVGFRQVSNIRVAQTRDRMDEFRQYAGVADTIGVEFEFITPAQIKELWPLASVDGFIGAIRNPTDGYLQPADLTQALAIGARNKGAEINRNTSVTGISRTRAGEWCVHTDKGDITCEHVISATGSFARQTGRMVGLDIPVIPVEHQYIVTGSHPDIAARIEQGLPEMGILRVPDERYYFRQEKDGLILGPYERDAKACYLDGTSADSEYELFQEDFDRLEKEIEAAMARVPAFGEAGVKEVYNGAICYTPDGNPIVGPAWDLPNFWLSEGHSFGITAAGGAGQQLAEWIVEGEPSVDMLGVDPRRYGDYCTKSYLKAKNEEAYDHVFIVHYPDEERPAARPLRRTPIHDRLKALGAVFGQSFGWDRANFFASEGTPQEDHWSFRRSNWHEAVGIECRNVMENVGILDLSGFAKCRISGAGAEAFLDRLVANRLPAKSGSLRLGHALSLGGGVHSEFSILRDEPDFLTGDPSFYVVSAGAFQRLDHDWIKKHMPADGSVRFDDLTNAMGTLIIAGPKARTLMQRVAPGTDFGNDAFPWLTAQKIEVGVAPCRAIRANFVGELGWELHHPIEYQVHIFDALMAAGADLGIAPFGIRAMESLRIEKSYRSPGREYSIELAALESGLARFVDLSKGDFIGKEGLVAWQQRGFAWTSATLEVHDTIDADALGSNPISLNGAVVGRCTSGNYGFRTGKSLVLATLNPEFAEIGQVLEIDILGDRFRCTVIQDSPYDPENERIKAAG